MNARRTPVLDLTDDPERLAAIVAAPWRRPDEHEVIIVTGRLRNGHLVHGRYARDVVDSTRPVVPAPAEGRVRRLVTAFLAHERASAAPAPATTVDPAEARIAAITAQLARTPVRVGTMPAPAQLRPSVGMSPERRRDLLGHTALGREIRDRGGRAERQAAARKPAPISARVRRALGTTDLGRRVLADRAERDPAGEAAARERAGGPGERRRRELLAGSGVGRAVLDGEDRRRRSLDGNPMRAG